MSSCTELLDGLKPPEHVVQLYGDDDRLLIQNVGRFLSEGLKRGDSLVVIATPEHRTSLTGSLRSEAGYSRAVLEGRLMFLDARATLDRILVDGYPDPELFESVMGESLRRVRARAVHTGVRAYGEMVGLLWMAGEREAAVQLEHLWNDLLPQSEVSLFCSYPVDVLSPEFESGKVDGLLCTHTHLLPADSALQHALDRAMDEVLGLRLQGLHPLFRGKWGAVPPTEALVLWIRSNMRASADQILARAREYYQPVIAARS
jgi:MEDS: MEthanogen/methylotroph, DcmR Sensory domain